MSTEGKPISNALVCVYGYSQYQCTKSDDSGYYEILSSAYRYDFYVYCDVPESAGVDYLPYVLYKRKPESIESVLNVTLYPAASVVINGQIRFVDYNKELHNYYYLVEHERQAFIDLGDHQLCYGFPPDDKDPIPLDLNEIIVPAYTPFNISVTPVGVKGEYRVEQLQYFEPFSISQPNGFTLSQGDVLNLDVRGYNLVSDFRNTIDAVDLLENELEAAGSEGYYVISELLQLQDLHRRVQYAENLYSQEKYDECYFVLRNAYLEAFSVRDRVGAYAVEAQSSMLILILFVAVTSFTLSNLVYEEGVKNRLFSVLLSLGMIAYLMLVHPGSQLLTLTEVTLVSVVSLIFMYLISRIQLGVLDRIRVGDLGLYG